MIRRDILRTICSVCLLAAVFAGRAGTSPWHDKSHRSSVIDAALKTVIGHRSPVIEQSAHPFHFDFNPSCREAYDELIRLRLGDAGELLTAEKKRDPANLVPFFLENYADFLSFFQ